MSFDRDLATLRALGPIEDSGFVKGTFALRLDLQFPGPMHKRPAALDTYLERAAAIMGPALAHYGGEVGFAATKGRKARDSDIAQLGKVSALMQRSFDDQTTRIAAKRKQIEDATGKQTFDHHFKVYDGGTLFIGDRLPVSESDSHIILNGFGGWGVSVSFGLDLVADKQAEILALAQDVLASGIAASGIFGFAINTHTGLPEDMQQRHYLPPTRRFAMLNPLAPSQCRFLPGDETGLMPVGCWYCLEDDWAVENGITPDDIAALEDQVYDLARTANGYLVKLWPQPILGDQHDAVDLGPAQALAQVLAPGFEAAHVTTLAQTKAPHGLGFLPVGTQADRWGFYRRFLTGAGRI